MAEIDKDQPISDTGANPQDHQFGREAAEDVDRVDRGERPEHDGEAEPTAGGKAEPTR